MNTDANTGAPMSTRGKVNGQQFLSFFKQYLLNHG